VLLFPLDGTIVSDKDKNHNQVDSNLPRLYNPKKIYGITEIGGLTDDLYIG